MRRVTLKASAVASAQLLLLLSAAVLLRTFINGAHSAWIFVDQRLHSVIEAVSAMAALVNAGLLNQAVRYHRRSTSYVWLSASMLTLGSLGLIHATVAGSANSMVWLELISSLIASFLALVSVAPARYWLSPTRTSLAVATVLAFSLVVGVLSLVLPGYIPFLVLEGKFTSTACFIGVPAAAAFLIACSRLRSRSYENNQSEDAYLSYYCLLSAVSCLYVPGYQIWGTVWWCWHLTQLLAHLTVLCWIARWVMRMNGEVVESERRLKMLAEAAYEAAVIAVDGTIIDINRAFSDMTGYSKNEVIGRRLSDFICDDYRNRPSRVSPIGKIRKQIVAVRRDNTIAFVEVRLRSIHTPERTFEVALMRDTTDRRVIELGLEELAASCHFLLHHLRRGVRALPSVLAKQATIHTESDEPILPAPLRGSQSPAAPEQITRQAHRIVRAADGLLQYSRARGKQTNQKPCSSATSVSKALEQLDGELRALAVETHVGELPVVVGDEALLLGLFRNLIEALIRSLDPKLRREIFIRAERVSDDWRFCFHRETNGEIQAAQKDDAPLVDVVCREIAARLGGRLHLEKDGFGLQRAYFSLPYFQWISVRR